MMFREKEEEYFGAEVYSEGQKEVGSNPWWAKIVDLVAGIIFFILMGWLCMCKGGRKLALLPFGFLVAIERERAQAKSAIDEQLRPGALWFKQE